MRELGRRRPDLPIAGGFIELSPPPLGEAVAELVERGVRRFAAVPLMLVSAGHAKGDIPAALAREKERHPGLTYTYGRPRGGRTRRCCGCWSGGSRRRWTRPGTPPR
ncbi:hypothetical protein SALBM217S_02260 [Streptomyces griseoloalbus]